MFYDHFTYLETEVKNNVSQALLEDVGAGDLTASLVPCDETATATVISRKEAVMCGSRWFEECFRQLEPHVEVRWHTRDGETVGAGQKLCAVKGTARALLTGERTALNFLQLLSAVSTQTRSYVNAISGTGAVIVDTRKTLPGLRLAQKYAVKCGGGTNHRIGLYDGILIKENHIMAAGGIEPALRAARRIAARGIFIQIEVETLQDLRTALDAGATLILLDNFDLEELREAVVLNARLTNKGAVLEASGGITLDNVRAVARTGVDRISIGGLTKDIKAIDLSMRFSSRS
ncbi:nicotinate-nucleotide pyrophosphorylase [carboxylating] [Nitrosospira multiformis ATCC 25196]|uniref:Probable nicotinate-nucleotide pyrophosphorylase [carboxylating] n=1 Tax=Nitrosospira multiformis (strain ATCC 25196 / NCIMB 11849 / C 71) TaxID=323848 RepID=Q2Y8S5_NITMU|nr:carboxylating nicotinate-nucleotide diphosphorylase [Nitrosospira multiformis]ABB74846.1 nicotinate-nucleotide pyrophosphorylase (carboxylating) [Nitrosospira multiformis ATCC 25196]SEF91740.1 nicotinate-nucleotide pyrophosphorylase [carboxylating] [Nitrosospira multiformis ATCC 25196]